MLTFAQFIAEDQHSIRLKRETGAFFRKNPEYREGLRNPDKAINSCGKVSYRLKRHLQDQGIKAALIRGRHSLAAVEPDAHDAYHKLDPKHMFHFAVKSGKHVIDATGSQFGKKYAGPQVMPFGEFKKRWKTVGHSQEWF